jgi:hypothetical protein
VETAGVGQTLTLTLTPEAGYAVAAGFPRVEATQGGAPVELSPGAANVWTFVMPASAVEVSVEFTAQSYSISIPAMNNGTLTATVGGAPATTAATGQTVTLTASPDEGYALKTNSLRVTAGGGTVETERPSSWSYTFTMPASNVLVAAEFDVQPDFLFEYYESVNPAWTYTEENGGWKLVIRETAETDLTALKFGVLSSDSLTLTVEDPEDRLRASPGSPSGPMPPNTKVTEFTVNAYRVDGVKRLDTRFGGDSYDFTLRYSGGGADGFVPLVLEVEPHTTGVAVFTVAENGALTRITGMEQYDAETEPLGPGIPAFIPGTEASSLTDALAYMVHRADDVAEYLIRVEKNEEIPNIYLELTPDATLRLRGYGGERTIEATSSSTDVIYGRYRDGIGWMYGGQNAGGTDLIHIGARRNTFDPGVGTLVLEENITILGNENNLVPVQHINGRSLININFSGVLEMKDGSKITAKPGLNVPAGEGYRVIDADSWPDVARNLYQAGRFIMSGGAITGNPGVLSTPKAMAVHKGGNVIAIAIPYNEYAKYGHGFIKTGGTISGNFSGGLPADAVVLGSLGDNVFTNIYFPIVEGQTYALPAKQ